SHSPRPTYIHTLSLHDALPILKSTLHTDFESGAINEKEFRNGIRMAFNKEWEDEWIDKVWNTLLLTIPKERVELLKALKKNYNRSEEHTSELQSRENLVCRLLL